MKAYLLFGRDNPVDGLVLGVILERVRQIRRDRGITVPFPEDSRTVLDTVAKALLFNPDRSVKAISDKNQLKLGLEDFAEAREAELRITHKIEEAAKREDATRSLFAQHSIKAEELETDLHEADAAIGDVAAVERFVTGTLMELLGAQIDRTKTDWRLHTGNLSATLRVHLPDEALLDVSFRSPTPKKHIYLGRNHPFVEALCQFVMARSLARAEIGAAARAAVMRTKEVTTKTTLLLFRCRNVIGEKNGPARIVAEEMLAWGYRGSPNDGNFLDNDEAMKLLLTARPGGDLTPQSRENFFDNETKLLGQLRKQFDAVAEERNKKLVEAHERFSRFFRAGRYEVVYPVLPMDIMGLYVLLPEGGAMNYPSIRIEGSILSGELLAKSDSPDTQGQRPADFGFDSQGRLKDEIVRAWAAGQAFYKAFQHKLEGAKEGTAATSETRNQWIIPLLGLLGYAELESKRRQNSSATNHSAFRIVSEATTVSLFISSGRVNLSTENQKQVRGRA